MTRKEISTKEDVELLVRSFYAKVVKDPLLAPHFKGIDFEHHFPRMFAFWNFILLDENGFTGNVFDKHVPLQIDASHFKQWLKYFHETVDELFFGEKAELAKQRADLLGYTFQSKLEHLRNKK
jgi:hemoglobin